MKVTEIEPKTAEEKTSDLHMSEKSKKQKFTYEEGTIQHAIEKKLDIIDRTRRNRINLSNRLMSYGRAWKFIFFIINIEAVIFVLLSFTNSVDAIEFWIVHIPFDLLSGIFTIYVILLQYYINVLNYNERGLKAHYHELELRDLVIKLKVLLMRDGLDQYDEDKLIDEFESIVTKYQMALKNNENHSKIDNDRTVYGKEIKENIKKGLQLKELKNPKPKDRTSDILLIYANGLLTIVMLIIILKVVLF